MNARFEVVKTAATPGWRWYFFGDDGKCAASGEPIYTTRHKAIEAIEELVKTLCRRGATTAPALVTEGQPKRRLAVRMRREIAWPVCAG